MKRSASGLGALAGLMLLLGGPAAAQQAVPVIPFDSVPNP